MVAEDYWTFVQADPRDWDRNQKVLFWWLVACLEKVSPNGVIAAPDKSPLLDEQIIEVFEAVLPEEGRAEKSYLDQVWEYQGQSFLFPSIEGNLITVKDGKIGVEEDPASDQRGIA